MFSPISDRVILSLCDESGNWPHYYRAAGYRVVQVDLSTGQDVRLFQLPAEKIHGVLAAPPCTCFSRAGARWKRTAQQMTDALSVVDACVRIALACRPVWWCLENPAGMLRRYLGPPASRFNPCDFGDPWTKLTCLWGNFTAPAPGMFSSVQPVAPVRGSLIHRLPGCRPSDSEAVKRRKRLARAITPMGFARGFFECNP